MVPLTIKLNFDAEYSVGVGTVVKVGKLIVPPTPILNVYVEENCVEVTEVSDCAVYILK